MGEEQRSRRSDIDNVGDRVAASEARAYQQALGLKLRERLDWVLEEPVPEDFLTILRDADVRC